MTFPKIIPVISKEERSIEAEINRKEFIEEEMAEIYTIGSHIAVLL